MNKIRNGNLEQKEGQPEYGRMPFSSQKHPGRGVEMAGNATLDSNSKYRDASKCPSGCDLGATHD